MENATPTAVRVLRTREEKAFEGCGTWILLTVPIDARVRGAITRGNYRPWLLEQALGEA